MILLQAFAMCTLDYEFHILYNAFLIHEPGIKTVFWNERRDRHAPTNLHLMLNVIKPEIKRMYGSRFDCSRRMVLPQQDVV